MSDLASLESLATPRQAEGATAIFAAVDGKPAGELTVGDPVKSTTPDALAELCELGVNVLMLTGDSPCTAEAVAKKLGIADFQAGVTPHDRHEKVKLLKAAGHAVGIWLATASTTPPRCPPTWASRWAPARTSRWKAPA